MTCSSMRALVCALLLVVTGCRTVAAGLDERAEALLADYRSRPPRRFGTTSEAKERWQSGHYTVHVITSNERTVIERTAVVVTKEHSHVTIDRLGVGAQLRVRLTFTQQPVDRASFEANLTEAWVTEGEAPEVHHLGDVPLAVKDLAWRALERAGGDQSPKTLTAPAGVFDGCRAGRHAVVPLSGVVRAEEEGALRELLEFGEDAGGEIF
jgi:hypothetical protein